MSRKSWTTTNFKEPYKTPHGMLIYSSSGEPLTISVNRTFTPANVQGRTILAGDREGFATAA
jgi:hypothetical protein